MHRYRIVLEAIRLLDLFVDSKDFIFKYFQKFEHQLLNMSACIPRKKEL